MTTLFQHKDGTLWCLDSVIDGVATIYRQGGGLSVTVPATTFFADYTIYTAPQRFRASKVAYDGGDTYPCMLSDRRWNGWAMPYFTLEVALQIAAAQHDYMKYEDDRFIFGCPEETPEEWERFEPEIIDGQKMYPIGAGSWCWCEVVEGEEE